MEAARAPRLACSHHPFLSAFGSGAFSVIIPSPAPLPRQEALQLAETLREKFLEDLSGTAMQVACDLRSAVW